MNVLQKLQRIGPRCDVCVSPFDSLTYDAMKSHSGCDIFFLAEPFFLVSKSRSSIRTIFNCISRRSQIGSHSPVSSPLPPDYPSRQLLVMFRTKKNCTEGESARSSSIARNGFISIFAGCTCCIGKNPAPSGPWIFRRPLYRSMDCSAICWRCATWAAASNWPGCRSMPPPHRRQSRS